MRFFRGVGTFLILGGPNLVRREIFNFREKKRKFFNFKSSRLPETAISRVFVKKKYSTSEKIFN